MLPPHDNARQDRPDADAAPNEPPPTPQDIEGTGYTAVPASPTDPERTTHTPPDADATRYGTTPQARIGGTPYASPQPQRDAPTWHDGARPQKADADTARPEPRSAGQDPDGTR
jgi:hypothetical protein